MKRYGNLFEKICTIENFYEAYDNATKGKHWYSEVIEIEKDKDTYLRTLLYEVQQKIYRVSEYEQFKLWSGGKLRDIAKLPMRDRIVQHAIMIHLEPIFRECFIQDTYASIRGRGIHQALFRVKQELREHPEYKYQLSLDIKKCYPSLDKNILKSMLYKKFKDVDLLDLLFVIVDSYNPNSDKGVPIGNYTSQYFNNFYFTQFDHWIKETKGIKAYFRYCDNIKILGTDKASLHALFKEIKTFIQQLNVEIKSDWQISPIADRGIDFVGYIIKPDVVRLRKGTKRRFINKVKKMDLNKLSKHDINVLGSYWGILKHGDCRNLWFKYTHFKTFKELIKHGQN